jgi:hypothetical protein
MAVYVDDVRFPYGRMVMCHMWADTLPELLAAAEEIGMNVRWLQQPPKASWVHFDISLMMKARAIKLGAILTDRYGALEHTARLLLESEDPDRQAIGTRQMAMIERARALRSPA